MALFFSYFSGVSEAELVSRIGAGFLPGEPEVFLWVINHDKPDAPLVAPADLRSLARSNDHILLYQRSMMGQAPSVDEALELISDRSFNIFNSYNFPSPPQLDPAQVNLWLKTRRSANISSFHRVLRWLVYHGFRAFDVGSLRLVENATGRDSWRLDRCRSLLERIC